jgi:hypothetical protein
MEQFGSDTTNLGEDFKLNNAAYLIWENVGKTPQLSQESIKELTRTCVWMEGVARRGAKLTSDYVARWDHYIDTYAMLLYKVGRTAEAIKWEEFAIAKMKETVKDEETVKNFSTGYGNRLEKMRKNEPTWPIEKAK